MGRWSPLKPIVSKQIRIRHPEHFHIQDDSIVDDFCYFSTRVYIGRCTHIANGCSVAGGVARTFRIGDFSSLSAGVKIWCTSDDFRRDVVALLPPGMPQVKEHLIEGDVELGDYTAVGANSVVMPGNTLPEGCAIGALSFVPASFELEPWTVYAGTPVRRVAARDEARVRAQVERIERFLAERDGA